MWVSLIYANLERLARLIYLFISLHFQLQNFLEVFIFHSRVECLVSYGTRNMNRLPIRLSYELGPLSEGGH